MLERRVLLSAATSNIDLLSGSPAIFVQNKGQWDSAVRYALQSSGANILMTDQGPVFQIFKDGSGEQFFAKFDGSNTVRPTGSLRSRSQFNYYVGDSDTWQSKVPGYQQISYANLYDGIDLKTWGKSSSLKYEFHVAPGADYSQVQISYDGVKGLRIDSSGRLHIKTQLGELVDDAPVVYQMNGEKRVEIKSSFRLIDKDTYTFDVKGAYDHNKELILDPDLDWSTFLGGDGADSANAVTVAGDTIVTVVGSTASVNFPTFPAATTGNVTPALDTTFGGGDTDAFVTWYSTDGTLIYSTYYGGTGADVATSVITDNNNSTYIAGYTSSSDFGLLNAIDANFDGNTDAFVVQLLVDGTLGWSTYLGGDSVTLNSNAIDHAYAIDIDGSGNLYVGGDTSSLSFPSAPTANGAGYGGGATDGFLTKINNTATPTLAWSRYVGGDGTDVVKGISVNSPDVSIVGNTTSTTGLTTTGALDESYNGNGDAFNATLDTATGGVTRASYLGGAGIDEANAIDYDDTDQFWVTGSTTSSDFPLSASSDPTYGGGGDAFLVGFNAGAAIVSSSFIGGSQAEVGFGVTADGLGNIIVVGSTGSGDLPVVNPFPVGFGGGATDAFIFSVTNANVINYLGYIGGSGADVARGVDVDGSDSPVIVGSTSSTNFPANGEDTTLASGGTDGFVTRVVTTIGGFTPLAPLNLRAIPASMTEIDLSWTDVSNNELGFEISRRVKGGTFEVVATVPRNTRKYADRNLQPSTTYIYKVRAFNAGGGSDSDEAQATTKTAGLHKPTGLTTMPISAHRIDLKWRDNSDNENNFEIYRALQSEGIFSLIATLSAGTTTYHDQTGLAPDTTYLYRVRATNVFRTSRFSEQVPGTTKDANFIAAPTGLSVNHTSDTTNVLSWTDNSDNETRFSIERTVAGEDDFQEVGSSNPNVSTFTDETAEPGVIYFYRVQAVRNDDTSDFSNIAASDLEAALAEPTFLEALSVSWDQIKLTWIDNALIETGQIIERAPNKPTGWEPIATVDPDTNVFYDKHVQTGRRYYYRVRATDGHNFSVYSNSATDRVLQEFLTAPRAPSRFKAQVVADGNVRLSWRDNTEVETGFLLERSTDPFGPFVRLKLLPPETTAFIDRSTSAGVHYYYRVRTIDSTTRSAATEVADVTTPSPVKLTITTLEAPGKEDGTTIKFLIRRKSLDGHSFTGGDLLVNYAIGGTATNGVDYDSLDGTILIPDGEATVQLIVSPFDDTLPEGNETVSVTLLGGRGYKISPNGNKQTAEIEDDDFIDASSKVASIFGKKSINSAIDLVDLS
jgi:fibronectin type 3 domain-containing protein